MDPRIANLDQQGLVSAAALVSLLTSFDTLKTHSVKLPPSIAIVMMQVEYAKAVKARMAALERDLYYGVLDPEGMQGLEQTLVKV